MRAIMSTWSNGNSTRIPRASSIRTVASPTSGAKPSTRQVTKSCTVSGVIAAPYPTAVSPALVRAEGNLIGHGIGHAKPYDVAMKRIVVLAAPRSRVQQRNNVSP